MSPNGSESSNETMEFALTSKNGWFWTSLLDWVALHPDMTPTAFRLYYIIRSLISEKQTEPVRVLSHDELAYLLPNTKGTPTGIQTVKDALKVLDRIGLVTNPDGRKIVESRGRGTIQTRRRYQVNDFPPDGSAYVGWRNTFAKLAAYQDDWRDPKSDVYAGQFDRRNSVDRSEQPGASDTPPTESSDESPSSPAQTRVTPGQIEGRNSVDDERNSVDNERDFVDNADVTCGDAAPNEVSIRKSSSLGSGPKEQEEEGSLAREDGDGVAAAVGVLDRALAIWPRGHRRPVAAERARLVERVAAELSSGAEEEDVVYHLSRDLEPSRVSTTAVQVVMGRTKAPGWGLDPRPASQAPHSATESPRVECGLHAYATVPCGQCRADFRVGDVQALRVELERLGAQERPDLAALLGVATAAV